MAADGDGLIAVVHEREDILNALDAIIGEAAAFIDSPEAATTATFDRILQLADYIKAKI